MDTILEIRKHAVRHCPEVRNFSEAVKNRIHIYDPEAKAILFGSRARGDAEPDSDWDLLVLTKRTDTEFLMGILLTDLLHQVEMPNNWIISLLVRNEDDWNNAYAVTPFYDSIQKEGIEL
jgi:predicted nucleotidyltransferase